MGNECIGTSTFTPNQLIINIINETPFVYNLNKNITCECKSQHKGFKALHGKFIENDIPQDIIEKYSTIYFPISSHAKDQVRPKVEL